MVKTGVKLIAKLVLCLVLLLILTGCSGGTEVNDLEIVILMGVEKDEATGDIQVTAQIVKKVALSQPSGDGGGESGKAYWNVSGTGKTVFDAVRMITHKTGNRLFVSHNQAVFFGKELAEEGLQEYLDFFLRAHEMRPTAMILITEVPIQDVMNAKPETENFPGINLTKLMKTYGFTSYYYKMNMKNFSSCLMCDSMSPVAPLISISTENGSRDINISGMAVFRKDKMVGSLSFEETRGLLWVLGEVKSGVIVIPSPEKKGLVSFEIIEAKSKVKPEIGNGKITFHIKIKVDVSLSEQMTDEILATEQKFKKMQNDIADAIRKEIMTTYEKSKKLNADIFGFGELLHKKQNGKWKIIKNNWEEIYQDLELDIDVEALIRKTDLLKKPVAAIERGNKK